MSHKLILRAGVLAFGLLAFLALTVPPAVTTVPFHYVHHELLVNARIGGSGPYTFLLDTGTTPSIIDVALMKRLGLPFEGAAAHGTDIGSGSMKVYPVTLRAVDIGSLRMSRLDALAVDISDLGNKLGVHIDGVLGSNFFDGRVVEVNYSCRTVSVLSDAMLAPVSARFTENASGYIVTNDVWVGPQRASATIDTGDSGTMLVTGTGIAALHLRSAASTGKAVSGISYGGRHRETEGMLPGVRIGSTLLGTALSSRGGRFIRHQHRQPNVGTLRRHA
ncbi:MAG: retropepsin-like domain-containing protein [Candidatus Eremiobacteraeota bacterium]|nr:retropepsin-like domain-containing protein [Candidatus Eremiobacteraeota bacterium]